MFRGGARGMLWASQVARAIRARRDGKKPPKEVQFPGLEDGAAGVAFIGAAVRSSKANSRWVKV